MSGTITKDVSTRFKIDDRTAAPLALIATRLRAIAGLLGQAQRFARGALAVEQASDT
jgi:hypothetical protein